MATEAQRAFARNIYAAAQKATDIAPEFVTAQATSISSVSPREATGPAKPSSSSPTSISPRQTAHSFLRSASSPSRSANPQADGTTLSIDSSKTSTPCPIAYANTPDYSRNRAMPTHGHIARMQKSSHAASATTRGADMQPLQSINSNSCS